MRGGVASASPMRLAKPSRAGFGARGARPKTATVAPASTLHVFQTAPQPVATPQPSIHTLCSGASIWILAADISAMTCGWAWRGEAGGAGRAGRRGARRAQ
eukprot:2626855-Prymnesium_polylepis.1